jgi:hypothetical protein
MVRIFIVIIAELRQLSPRGSWRNNLSSHFALLSLASIDKERCLFPVFPYADCRLPTVRVVDNYLFVV